MDEKKTFYITTAIAYSSRKPHIGNTYEAIATDAIARYKRQRGYDVFFLTGTDEHGQKIERCAEEAGISPKEYVDGVAGEIKRIWDLMGVSYTRFIRTTDADHVAAVQRVFTRLYEQGDIYKDAYEGWYCVPCESFFTETQAHDHGGCCPDCGAPLQKTKEEAYFFRMSAYQDRLLRYIEEHPDWIAPESRRKEMVNNFLKTGLQDLCVSRSSFTWGIPVPFDQKHIIYVWIDALFNYATALGFDVDAPGAAYTKYWPADCHVIGKDIMRFHSIYWPIFLMALGQPLPKKLFGHPWFLFGTDKMSKSKGNVLYADDLAARFSVDAVRHYCLAEMPYASDGSITPSAIIARYNTDLANNLGNLVSRSHAMTVKYFGGKIPARGEETETDAALRMFCEETKMRVWEALDSYHIADAVDALFALFGRANKYIDETMPWALAKDESKTGRLGTVMYYLLEAIRYGAALLTPFLPTTADKIRAQLGGADDSTEFFALQSGTILAKAETLFARLDEKAVLAEMEAEQKAVEKAAKEAARAQKQEAAAAKQLPQISLDDFSKLELRCGQIIKAERIPKSDKLLCLEVDLGAQTRQIVSGIAKAYEPQALQGKKVIVLCNLAPAKLRGVQSDGMILAGGEELPQVIFLDDAMPLGTRIR